MRLSAAALVACAIPITAQTAHAAAAGIQTAGTQTVTYLGHSFTVPASWPVITVDSGSTTCVRFDQHAVYLGAAPADQQCPDHAFGRTDAIELQPAAAGAATGAAENPTGRQIRSTAAGITAIATYSSSPSQVAGILASGGLATAGSTRTSTAAPAVSTPAAASPATAATVPASATQFTGEAFDACSAPSAATLAAWKGTSPYGALGIYIGGANEACSQPNLTPAWVSAEAAAGWHFFLLYVGLQAPGSTCTKCAMMTDPVNQGASSAQDAYSQATNLGFGPGTPIFFDMEAYPSTGTTAALTFMSEWTRELHTLRYNSGEYSSESWGIKDLVNSTTVTEPDAIDFANWNGVDSTTVPADTTIPATDWPTHQRIHQYSDNGGTAVTYGGVAMGIDSDAMDISLPAPPVPAPASQPSVLANSDGTADVYTVLSDGNVWGTQSLAGGGFAPWQALSTSGVFTGRPAVLRMPSGVIAVYARTTAGTIMGTSQSTAGGAFSAWVQLGSATNLVGDPAVLLTAGKVLALYSADSSGRIDGISQSVAYGPFGAWQALSGNLGFATEPAVIQNSAGIIALYALGASGSILGSSQSVVAGPFSGWIHLGSATSLVSPPTALVTKAGVIAVYAADGSGQIDGISQSVAYGPFGGWQTLSPNLGFSSRPAVLQSTSGALGIYALTSSGTVQGTSQSVVAGPFGAWSQIGGAAVLANGPTALLTSGGEVDLFAADTATGDIAASAQSTVGGAFGSWADV